MKAFPHCLHSQDFSPIWIHSCLWRPLKVDKAFPHSCISRVFLHCDSSVFLKVTASKESFAALLTCIGPLSTVTSSMCSKLTCKQKAFPHCYLHYGRLIHLWKELEEMKTFPLRFHSSGSSPVWVLSCFWKHWGEQEAYPYFLFIQLLSIFLILIWFVSNVSSERNI